jgi:hypothetical protein
LTIMLGILATTVMGSKKESQVRWLLDGRLKVSSYSGW